jgi:hypothetical protein
VDLDDIRYAGIYRVVAGSVISYRLDFREVVARKIA